MSEPANDQRLEALTRLTNALKEITPDNGYQHDLSGNVFRGRVMYGTDDPIPLVSILEPPIPPDQLPTPKTGIANAGDYEILIQGFVEDDKENPTDPAYRLLADVKRRLAVEKARGGEEAAILDMGDYITGMDIGLGVVRPADEVSAKAYFYLLVVLKIVDDMAEPFG